VQWLQSQYSSTAKEKKDKTNFKVIEKKRHSIAREHFPSLDFHLTRVTIAIIGDIIETSSRKKKKDKKETLKSKS